MQPQVLLDRLARAGPVRLDLPPLLGEGPESDLAAGWIDIRAGEDRVLDLGQESLGIQPPVEGPGAFARFDGSRYRARQRKGPGLPLASF